MSAGPLNVPTVSRGDSLAAESSALGVRRLPKALHRRAGCGRAAKASDVPGPSGVSSGMTRSSHDRTSQNTRSGNSSNTMGR